MLIQLVKCSQCILWPFKNPNIVHDDVDIVLPDNVSEHNIESNQVISEKDVFDSVKSLKNIKTCVGDHTLNDFLKHSVEKLMPFLFRFLMLYMKLVLYLAHGLKVIFVQSIKMKGDKADADHYKEIILRCFGKLFTCILNNRLFNYLGCLGL